MQTLDWYYKRFKIMSPGEIVWRIRSSLRNRADRILVGHRQHIRKPSAFLNGDGKDEEPEFRVSNAADIVDKRWYDSLLARPERMGKKSIAMLRPCSFMPPVVIDRNVSFAGHQDVIENWLRKSKVFALTSDSEGLSLSMMEAMMCGLPAVVSDIGDLGDLVEDGVNGYLVPRCSPDLFANRIIELLTGSQKLTAFSKAARQSALQYETQATTQHWDSIIANLL